MGDRARDRERASPGRLASLAAPLLAMIGLAGCATTQTVVLMPDPDGSVGRAEVATASGTQALTRAGDMTSVRGASAAPAPVKTADPTWISATFAEALAVEPPPPEKFILYFEPGTTSLDARSRSAVDGVVAAIRRRGAVSVSVSGHTDATGSDSLNEKLALDRSERVRALLREHGVAPETISLSSHGKGNPAIPTPDGVAEPRNRRVEVLVR